LHKNLIKKHFDPVYIGRKVNFSGILEYTSGEIQKNAHLSQKIGFYRSENKKVVCCLL